MDNNDGSSTVVCHAKRGKIGGKMKRFPRKRRSSASDSRAGLQISGRNGRWRVRVYANSPALILQSATCTPAAPSANPAARVFIYLTLFRRPLQTRPVFFPPMAASVDVVRVSFARLHTGRNKMAAN